MCDHEPSIKSNPDYRALQSRELTVDTIQGTLSCLAIYEVKSENKILHVISPQDKEKRRYS